MRHRLVLAAVLVAVVALTNRLVATAQKLPLKDGKPIVAAVNDEVITLGQLLLDSDQAVDTARLADGRGTDADFERLNRLITVRLIVQESTTMGIADLPEIRKQVEVTSRSILREVLMAALVKDVVADDASVEAAFKDLAQEWKTTSLLFADETLAHAVRAEIAGGADFAAVCARVVAEKQAKTEGDDSYHRRKEYLPEIAQEIAKLRKGDVSPLIRIPAGFVVVKLADVRYPDSASVRAEARRVATSLKQQAALEAEEDALHARYVVVHQDVFDSIDYEAAQPGLDALLKDARVVAEIRDASPLTVADLTEYLKLQFFHGGQDAAQGKRMNSRKQAALDATLGRRVLNLEAARRGIDRTDEYLDRVEAFEDSLVFDAFVQKVIAPDQKMREQEVRSYYEQHLSAYSYPGMVRLRALAFTRRGSAEAAIEKLRKGTDYGWLAANADDQIGPDARALAVSDGQLVMIDSLAEAVQKALADPKAGDFRLFAHPDAQFYVFAVQEVVAPAARPYAEVREDIARKLYGEKLKKGVEDYAARLRAASKVVVYLRKSN